MECHTHNKFIVEWSVHAYQSMNILMVCNPFSHLKGLDAMLKSSRANYSSIYSMFKYFAVIK